MTTSPAPLTDLPFAGRTFAAVLFDMDGTLVDSMAVVRRSWLRWAEEYAVEPVALRGWHGVPARGVIAGVRPDLAADALAAAVLRIEELETDDTEGIVVLPGAARALDGLLDAGAHAAVVTSCTDPLAESRLAASGLRRPPVVVTASMVEHGKPHPEPFLLAAARLGVDPRECLVVEDAPAGLRAARAAGCATLAVLGTTDPAELASLADLVVAGLDAIALVVDADGRITVRTAAER